jgi:hypothetical protein
MCTHEHEQPPPGGFEPAEAESALEALTPTLEAIPPDEVRRFPVNATAAVGLGLAFGEAFAEDRERFAAALQPEEFDPADYDDLGQRAMAFWQADIQVRQELNKESPLKALLAEGKPLRSKLLGSAEFLWAEHPELGDVVAGIRKGQGHQDMADDLGALHELFSDHWDKAVNQCPVTLEDVARAKVVGAEMLQAMSPSRSKELDEAKDTRRRAAEHLRRGLEEVRAAALYVFRNDEAKIERYPSLFILRRKHRGSDTGEDEVTSSVGSEPSGPTSGAGEPSAETGDPADETPESHVPIA